MIISPRAFELIYFLQFNISVYFLRRMYLFHVQSGFIRIYQMGALYLVFHLVCTFIHVLCQDLS